MIEGSLPALLERQADERGDAVALREKEFGIWHSISWNTYARRVRHFALGLLELGVQRGDRIAIIGDNRPEWVIAELGAQAIGALPTGLFQDAVVAEIEYVLAKTQTRLVVGEDQEQVDKILSLSSALPSLKHIVYYDPQGLRSYTDPALREFVTVEERGADREASYAGDEYTEVLNEIDPDDTALLCTTSGTTSKPKLAMLSHRNLNAMADQLLDVDPMSVGDEFVSFLPLAWIGEQMVTVASALATGFVVNFPEEPGTVRQDLKEIGPQSMFSPPRIWESMVSDVQVLIEDTTPLKRRLYSWAKSAGEDIAETRFSGGAPTRLQRARARVADWVALGPIRDQLGLRRLRRAYTGGAALGPDVFRFFHTLGVNLKQIYGQTEVSGISVLHRDGDIRAQSVGLPLPDTEIRIGDDGEILTRGPAVFRGYFEDSEATSTALQDGWLHSGDAGYFDDAGHLVVIDRLKDVSMLPDGTTFSPQFLENQLKFSHHVSEAVAFGGSAPEGAPRPYIVAIIAIDYENVGQWAERRQLSYTTYTDLAQKPEVYDLIRNHVAGVNSYTPVAARVRRFVLLHKELHADDGELTRTRKVRRRFIEERFEQIVQALYGGQSAVTVAMDITYQDGRTRQVTRDLRIETLSAPPENSGV